MKREWQCPNRIDALLLKEVVNAVIKALLLSARFGLTVSTTASAAAALAVLTSTLKVTQLCNFLPLAASTRLLSLVSCPFHRHDMNHFFLHTQLLRESSHSGGVHFRTFREIGGCEAREGHAESDFNLIVAWSDGLENSLGGICFGSARVSLGFPSSGAVYPTAVRILHPITFGSGGYAFRCAASGDCTRACSRTWCSSPFEAAAEKIREKSANRHAPHRRRCTFYWCLGR